MSVFFFLFGFGGGLVIQVRTMASAGGPDNLVLLDPAKYKARPQVPEPAGDGSATQPKWQVGEQEYEALMRMLDNLVRKDKPFVCLSAVALSSYHKLTFCWHCSVLPPLLFAGLPNRLPIPLSVIARQSKKVQ